MKGDSSGGVVKFSETEGAFAPTRRYLFGGGLNVVEEFGGKGEESGGRWKVTLRQVFLPYGYPDSVSKDYVAYQTWDTLQAFASSITGALATEAVMKGVGVGESLATPLSAAVTWLLKSGSGHVGQIVFAWAKGTSLDGNCKQWRLFADILNDLATFVDLLAPWAPKSCVVFVLCGASIARALVGVAGSATRAAVTVHQARRNNMGDVSAKDGSQETLVNLLALLASLVILPMVSGNPVAVWLLFVLFTGIHLFGNFKAVRSLEMETWNEKRLLVALEGFLTSGHVGSVKEVNLRESVFLGRGLRDVDVTGGGEIRLGVRLEDALQGRGDPEGRLRRALEESEGRPWLMFKGDKRLSVVLHEGIKGREVMEAFVEGILVWRQRKKTELQDMLREFRRLSEGQGWEWERGALVTGDWRAKWTHKD